MSSKIKIHAGNLTGEMLDNIAPEKTYNIKYKGGNFYIPHMLGGDEKLGVADLEELEVASEESVKRVGGTVGWGVAGAMVLGPVGLLAGLLLGGKKNEVTFVAKFKDGRRALATTDSKTFKQIQAARF